MMGKLLRVDVIVDDVENNPYCPHGPTLRFRRITEDGERDYFACSACRDRKDCKFHVWCDRKVTKAKMLVWELEKCRVLPRIDHVQLLANLQQVWLQKEHKRVYCHSCSVLVLSDHFTSHSGHDVTITVTAHQLTHPSELIKPLDNPKKEAQFLFSKQTTNTILKILVKNGIRHVLCIGTPRIHEQIQDCYGSQLSSLLLDIDHRYHQFFSERQFCWFNCFNNHFFAGGSSKAVLSQFLKKDDGEGIALITDPPFGGRVEPLAYTIRQMSSLHTSLNPAGVSPLSVMWIFPYFMEPQILAVFPNYHMSDYKVHYDNHPLFTQGAKSKKRGSAIRIFTNMSCANVMLPSEEGYKYCSACERWVSFENRHCNSCGYCTSKNGETYVHCLLCKRCVKPSWQHCTSCNRCALAFHNCQQFATARPCSTCNMTDHYTSNCPLQGETFQVHEVKRRRKRINEPYDELVQKKCKDPGQSEDENSSFKKSKRKNFLVNKTKLTVSKKAKSKKKYNSVSKKRLKAKFVVK